jgi:hypothetical protein
LIADQEAAISVMEMLHLVNLWADILEELTV